jgi:hypothetical protein
MLIVTSKFRNSGADLFSSLDRIPSAIKNISYLPFRNLRSTLMTQTIPLKKLSFTIVNTALQFSCFMIFGWLLCYSLELQYLPTFLQIMLAFFALKSLSFTLPSFNKMGHMLEHFLPMCANEYQPMDSSTTHEALRQIDDELWEMLIVTFGKSYSSICSWLTSRPICFNKKTPLEVLLEKGGIDRVKNTLLKMQHGNLA